MRRFECLGAVCLTLLLPAARAARDRRLEARGVVFTGPTRGIPGKVKLAEFADPDGNRIRLAQGLAP